MSNYNNLKTTIDANIKQNGNQEITGPILNSVLNQMVNILGTGYQFAGVAALDPATDPGTPDAKVFYIANGKGTYTNFGSLEVTEDEVVVLYWDSSWHKVSTGIASQAKLSELEHTPIIADSPANIDLDIEDQSGNKLARFMGGHIKTKNFDSSTDAPTSSDDTQTGDLEFTDTNNNVLMRLYNGHVKTKEFDSSSIEKKNISQSLWKLISSVNLVNVFKKVCCIGDSLTAGYTSIGSVNVGSAAARPLGNNWPAYMENLTGGNQYDNIAIGSSTAHHWRYEDGPQTDYKPDLDLANDSTYEAYIIALGVNDKRTNVAIGTTSDIASNKSSNADTFCGNYDYIVRQLMEWNPKAHIFCLTIPLSEGNNVIQYNTIINDIGNLYPNKAHVISLEGDDVDLLWISENFANGHYCPIVYNYFATIIYRRISDFILDNNIIFRETPYK